MNAVEIEQAISELAEQPFDPAEFPHAFLTAFGNKDTTIKRLRSGGTNKSDFAGPWGGVLQTNNIHLAACAPGDLPPVGPSVITRVCRFVRCSPTLDRRMLEFLGLCAVSSSFAGFRKLIFLCGSQNNEGSSDSVSTAVIPNRLSGKQTAPATSSAAC